MPYMRLTPSPPDHMSAPTTLPAPETSRSCGSGAAICSAGDFYRGPDGEVICALCDYEADVESCDYCEDGFDGHDCGEDCCCCEYPDENVPCQMCLGRGCNYYCSNNACDAFELHHRIQKPTS